MQSITITIPDLGRHTGTSGWLADYLGGTTVAVHPTKDTGHPALFAQFPKDEGQTRPVLIVKPAGAYEPDPQCYEWQTIDGESYALRHLQEDGHIDGIFGSLTPAAREKAEAWRQACLRAFAEAWANDGRETETA